MRTTKRFTPQVLQRFHRQGRGLGTFTDYIAWHCVSRGDPSSRGRSHLQMWQDRQRDLLSDHEWVILFFILMLLNLIDVREQFPLSLEEAAHEMGAYLVDAGDQRFPGTQAIARKLGIRHPITSEGKESADWVMSTDFLLALRTEAGAIELLAIAVKTEEEARHKRKRQLLAIEREYWLTRGVTWLLITPALYDADVGLNLRMQMPWMQGDPAPESAQQMAAESVRNFPGRSLTYILNQLTLKLGEIDLAQRAFWQAVLTGKIRMKLRRGWRPHQPVILLPEADFVAQNPIASRRSAWI
ncbi:TnsA endonuclease N-terminal domain-containing protein [Ferribacterium limneticum]|uniref:TnsA endonuclease N-terminal domain-containing protein n=1 Tax=Ferribacterium limneticum TaxID=76259 RepID=UPI001CF802EF|nr:TnsA endonuclease N-terminal domain-containing protein [Ferribacterium limneticum]UCV22565.1 Tn7 transposase TnsA N-terminal domain-containing protein [Ferribacterium limneticum]